MPDFLSSLRARLILLVLLATVPAFALILHTGYEQRQLARKAARDKVLNVARDAVDEQRHLLRDARYLLNRLARQPEIEPGGRPGCSASLASELKNHRQYINFGVIDLDGYLRCSALPFTAPVHAGDRLYFRRTIENGDFAIGEYQIGRITGRASVNLGYPLSDERGKLKGVVFGALDLSWLNEILAKSELPAGSVLFAVDQNGTFFARYPDGDKWVGKTVPYASLLNSVMSKGAGGSFEAFGVDGEYRLYAFEPLSIAGSGSVYVGVGFPMEIAYAEVNRMLQRNVIFLGLVSVLALLAAWFGGYLFVIRDVNTLVRATNRLASGDLSARVGSLDGQSELTRLGAAFDGMAASLQKQQRDISDNLDRIRALHEIDLAISSTLDLRSTLEILLEKVDRFFSFPTASAVRLLDSKTSSLEIVAFRNLSEAAWQEQSRIAGRRFAESIIATKAPVAICDIQLDPRTVNPEFFRQHGLFSYLGVPLSRKNKVVGVLSLYTKVERDFSEQDIEFLVTLGGQAAIAIQNSQLHEETKTQAVQLKLKAEELERANKIKEEFLNVMSHELRTPLTAIMGYAGLIKDRMLGEINPDQEKALERLLSRARDQVSMVNSILHASSLEAETMKLERQRFDLSSFLQELQAFYTFPIDKEVTLTWDYPSKLPTMNTDNRKLKIVLQNLIDNGIKFTDKGRVTVSVRVVKASANLHDVQFNVSDTGNGIAEANLTQIFAKFYQVDSSATRLYEGVGLGLYIVKRFTELLGGTVNVDSEPGKGSTFTVTIPCEAEDRRESSFAATNLRTAREFGHEKTHSSGRG
jgi:signal transduction histidine kinase